MLNNSHVHLNFKFEIQFEDCIKWSRLTHQDNSIFQLKFFLFSLLLKAHTMEIKTNSIIYHLYIEPTAFTVSFFLLLFDIYYIYLRAPNESKFEEFSEKWDENGNYFYKSDWYNLERHQRIWWTYNKHSHRMESAEKCVAGWENCYDSECFQLYFRCE